MSAADAAGWTPLFLRDGALALLLGSILALLVALAAPRKFRGPFETLSAVLTLAAVGVVSHVDFGWILAALPPLIVVHHALYVGRTKNRLVPPQWEKLEVRQELKPLFARAGAASDEYFDPANLALRYGVPALALLLVGLVLFYALSPTLGEFDAATLPDGAKGLGQVVSTRTAEAALFGLAGAYTYVVILLGRRAFRHDISTGSVLWCAVTLTLGPLLAGLCAKIGFEGGEAGKQTPGAVQAVFFVAGFSPRLVATGLEGLAARVLPGLSPPASKRSLALGELGLPKDVAARLDEEGIYDVETLAMADPVRLQRETSFDPRQLLDWMDQALLARYFPTAWEKLLDSGVTGAVDLAWYEWGDEAQEGKPVDAGLEKSLDALAKLTGIERPLLDDTLARVAQDGQVTLVWLLYQLGSEDVRAPSASVLDGGEPPPGVAVEPVAKPG